MANSLDIMIIGVMDKSSVVASVIVRSLPGGSVVNAARLDRSAVKGPNLLLVRSSQREVKWLGIWVEGEPEFPTLFLDVEARNSHGEDSIIKLKDHLIPERS